MELYIHKPAWYKEEVREMVKDMLKLAGSDGTNVVLYGAGKYGRIALCNIRLKYPEIKIKYFIDDDLNKNNEVIDGVSVITLDKAVGILGNDMVIFISNYYVTSIIQKIGKAGIDLSNVFFTNELLVEPVESSFIRKNKEDIWNVYNLLEDYESKFIYKTMIESHFTYNFDALNRTCQGEQYFPEDIFKLHEDEVFIDAGAYIGDTIDAFKKNTNNKFKYIYAFEPHKQLFNGLITKYMGDGNIKLFNKGLYKENGRVPFFERGGSSAIEMEGKEEIEVCSFDQLTVPDKKVSFIKMDIEGSELNALYGMSETIRIYTPKLAICIYHKFQDMWEIPLFIKQLNPGYKLYIRNYTTYMGEVVLYAVAG